MGGLARCGVSITLLLSMALPGPKVPWGDARMIHAQKFQLLVKLGGNCSLMPVKAWKFGAPTPAR
jgi:hypothetical protein